ncbi:hypothetical protein IW136_004363 [Coemansia sp. RSA 678]|nr:hypothetical protein IW136_004363 [Coemansia sp. RSA 678]
MEGSRTEDIHKEVEDSHKEVEDSHKEVDSHEEEDIHKEDIHIHIHKEEEGSRMEADRAADNAEVVAGGKELDDGRMGRMHCCKAFVRG